MWQVIGQERIISLLDYTLRSNAVAHAYLLVGPQHVGKGTLALNFAQALNCDGPDRPCGQCRSCRRILEGKHADVTITGLESGVEIGIDDIRGLQRLANLPPYEGKCKSFIIDDAECLSTEAANALLKILEEPPRGVVWILLATEEDRLPPTVVSRCQRLELRPLPSEKVREALIHSYKVDPERAKLLSRLCRGCFGRAVSALSDDDILERRFQGVTRLFSLINASLAQRFVYAQELAGELSQNRRAGPEIMEVWFDWWRDLLLVKAGCSDDIINTENVTALEEQAQCLELSDIRGFLTRLGRLQQEVSTNVNPRLALESLMLDLPAGARTRTRERGAALRTSENSRKGL